jgi:hypothetical protein
MHALPNIARLSLASTLFARILRSLPDFRSTLIESKASRASTPRNVRELAGDASCLHRITKPGIYALTAPLHGQPGKAGIIINADDVELRLCGTELIGTRGSHDGIVVRGHNCIIRDGAVRDWGHNGLDAMRALRCRLENVHCFQNGLYGILLGKHGEAIGCSISQNGGPGMETGAACTIVNCAAQGNWQRGFVAGSDSVSYGLVSSVNNVSGSVKTR